jgi:hypothetical protein
MAKVLLFTGFVFLIGLPATASEQEDKAADAVATGFVQARQQAHKPKLKRIGRNVFREKVCNHDMRFSSGVIRVASYETSDPVHLADEVRILAVSPDSTFVAARFGVGVCMIAHSSGPPSYSILVATYTSRWVSFWRTFWD